MYTALIVEDFPADLDALTVLLNDRAAFPDIQITGACMNGEDALIRIEAERPDILITDIDMPGMNGLELTRRARQVHPELKIIFCTMHHDFDFVHEALYLGGYGYVLKPIEKKELQDTLAKVMAVLDRETRQSAAIRRLNEMLHHHRPVLVENLLKELLYGLNKNEQDLKDKLRFFGIPYGSGPYGLILLEIDNYSKLTQAYTMEEKQLFSHEVFQTVEHWSQSAPHRLSVRIHDNQFAILIEASGISPGQAWIRHIRELSTELQNKFSRSDISVTLSIAGPCNHLSDCAELYEQASEALRYKYVLGKGEIIWASDLPETDRPPQIDFASVQKNLRFLLHSGSEKEVRDYIHELFAGIPETTDFKAFRNICLGLVASIYPMAPNRMRWEDLILYETAEDIRDWITGELIAVQHDLTEGVNNKNRFLVMKIRSFIEEHYQEQISLERLSEELFYSPNYINHVFKQETGETVYDYLTGYRMEKAKSLIESGSYKLYEIANLSGYSHSAYFSRLFKRHTGLTPKEYRERLS